MTRVTQPLSGDCRLDRQLAFVLEIDRLKEVLRRSRRINDQTRENTAEHSWHLVMMAMVLHEHWPESLDVARVMRMVAIHDLVEIDAGDTFVYDEAGASDKAAREHAAAKRIYGLLPPDQAREMRALWDEFEAKTSPEAQFAGALDRLMPLLHNFHGEGRVWRENGVVAAQVRALNERAFAGAGRLREFVHELIDEAVERGYLAQ